MGSSVLLSKSVVLNKHARRYMQLLRVIMTTADR